jgi:hypothetical protein
MKVYLSGFPLLFYLPISILLAIIIWLWIDHGPPLLVVGLSALGIPVLAIILALTTLKERAVKLISLVREESSTKGAKPFVIKYSDDEGRLTDVHAFPPQLVSLNSLRFSIGSFKKITLNFSSEKDVTDVLRILYPEYDSELVFEARARTLDISILLAWIIVPELIGAAFILLGRDSLFTLLPFTVASLTVSIIFLGSYFLQESSYLFQRKGAQIVVQAKQPNLAEKYFRISPTYVLPKSSIRISDASRRQIWIWWRGIFFRVNATTLDTFESFLRLRNGK